MLQVQPVSLMSSVCFSFHRVKGKIQKITAWSVLVEEYLKLD